MRSVDYTGDRIEDSSGLSSSSETTYFRMGDDSPGIGVVLSYQMLDPLACGITR